MRTGRGCGWLLGLTAFAFGSGAGVAWGQSYPDRPVRVHTTGAGGSVDFLSRIVANEFATSLKQPFVVENKAGNVLANGVAKSPPDGYTLLIWGPALWIGPLLDKTPYEMREFAYISTLTRAPNILVVNMQLPVKTVADLVKYAKANPGQLNYATGATGSSNHIGGELFKALSGTSVVRIIYKGGASEVNDLVSGRTHMTIGSGATFISLIKAGKVRALASGGLQRSLLLPDLPTIADTLPGYVSESVLGMFVPLKTPDAIQRRLNEESARVLAKPDVREKLLSVGQEPVGGAPERLVEIVQSEMNVVSKLIKDGAVQMEAQ